RLEGEVGEHAQQRCRQGHEHDLALGIERFQREVADQIDRREESCSGRETAEPQRKQQPRSEQAGEKGRDARLDSRIVEQLLQADQPRATLMTPATAFTAASARRKCGRSLTSKLKRMYASSLRLCVRTA